MDGPFLWVMTQITRGNPEYSVTLFDNVSLIWTPAQANNLSFTPLSSLPDTENKGQT